MCNAMRVHETSEGPMEGRGTEVNETQSRSGDVVIRCYSSN